MIKHLHNAVLYWISNHGVLFSHTVSECSSSKLNEIIKLDKKKNAVIEILMVCLDQYKWFIWENNEKIFVKIYVG